MYIDFILFNVGSTLQMDGIWITFNVCNSSQTVLSSVCPSLNFRTCLNTKIAVDLILKKSQLPQFFADWLPLMQSCCFPMQLQQRTSFEPCLTISAHFLSFQENFKLVHKFFLDGRQKNINQQQQH